MSSSFPQARCERLIVETLKDEVLVYDLDREQANCLNKTAALVWHYADGKTSVSDIADKLSQNLGMLVDVRVVWYALDQLNKKNLLAERVAIPYEYARMTRRDFLMKAGIVGAAVAIPVVIALAAPSAAMAATCTGACSSQAVCDALGTGGTCLCVGAPSGTCVA